MNLDQIRDRVDRGQYVPQDAFDLVSAVGEAVPADVLQRVNTGQVRVSDLVTLLNLADPGYADRVAVVQAQAQALADKANADRLAQAQAAVAAQAQAQQDWFATAQAVLQSQADAAAARTAAERFKANQQAANDLLAQKKRIKDSLTQQIS